MQPASGQYSLTDNDIQKRNALLEKKEIPRFFQTLRVDKWLHADETEGQRKIRYLEVAAKVTQVVTALLFVLMPLAVYYLPTWVPWGIGLPIILGLTFLAYPKMRKILDTHQRDQVFTPFHKKFLTTDSTKSLHPFGEWDLPSRDERLKSDKLAEKELHITRPSSGSEVEEIVGLRSRAIKTKRCADLEMTSYVDAEVALRFSGGTQRKVAWKATQAASRELERSAENREKFEEKRKKLSTRAYGGEYPTLDFPSRTPKLFIESTITFYQTLMRELEEAAKLHQKGSKKKRWNTNYAPWITHISLIEFLDKKMVAALSIIGQQVSPDCTDLTGLLKKLLASQENKFPTDFRDHLKNAEVSGQFTHRVYVWMFSKLLSLTSKDGCERTKKYLEQEQLQRHLYKAIQDTRQVKAELSAWVDSHSSRKLKALEAQFKAIKEEDYMSSKQLALLKAWYIRNTAYADKALITIPKEIKHQPVETWVGHDKISVKDFWKEFKPWMKRHPDKRYATPHELYDHAHLLHNAYLNAHADFKEKKKELATLCEAEKSKRLDIFKQEVMAPLEILTVRTDSKYVTILKRFIEKRPAKIFAPAKGRKIESILDGRLKQIDREMLSINRARVWALHVPRWLLLIVEAVVAIYFATPWIFWGISFLTLMGEGISLYIDYKLGEMDEEKQSIKLHRFLLDYPDVIRIPGARPDLIELQEIQAKYGLEGVAGTWASTLKKGDNVLEDTLRGGSARRKNHRDMSEARVEIEKGEDERRERFKETGLESSEKVTLYLRRSKIQLMSDLTRAVKKDERQDINRRIEILESATRGNPIVYPSPTKQKETDDLKTLPKRHIPSHSERLTIQRQKIDDEMDKIAEEAHKCSMKLTEYQKVATQFKRLERFLSPEFVAKPVQKGEIDALLDAMEGERVPKGEEINIQETLFAIKDIVLLTQFIKPHEHIERLRQVPVATLERYARALRKLQRYQSYFNDRASLLRMIAQEEQWIAGSQVYLQQQKFIYDNLNQDLDSIDKKVSELTELPPDQAMGAFKKMDPRLKMQIFPYLSEGFRKNLQEEYELSTGETLLQICKAEAIGLEKLAQDKRQEKWKKEDFFEQFYALHPDAQKYVLLFLPPSMRSFPEIMEMYLLITKPKLLPPLNPEILPSRLDKIENFAYQDPFKTLEMLMLEVFETDHGNQVHNLYLEKGSSMWWRLPAGYRYLVSGEALIAASSQAPADLTPYKKLIENSFFKIEPHRQREVYRALTNPRSKSDPLSKSNIDFKTALQDLYKECTGEALLEASKSLELSIQERSQKEAQQIFSRWQQKQGPAFLTKFIHLDPYHQRYISHFLPSFIRTWINKSMKDEKK